MVDRSAICPLPRHSFALPPAMPASAALPAPSQPALLRIGPYALPHRALVAPMAGVTDRPYRQLCKRLGAGYAVSEMAASNDRDRKSVV